jgi:hypothetical protein
MALKLGRAQVKLVGQRYKAIAFTDCNRKRTPKSPFNVALESDEFEYSTEN